MAVVVVVVDGTVVVVVEAATVVVVVDGGALVVVVAAIVVVVVGATVVVVTGANVVVVDNCAVVVGDARVVVGESVTTVVAGAHRPFEKATGRLLFESPLPGCTQVVWFLESAEAKISGDVITLVSARVRAATTVTAPMKRFIC